MLYIGFGGTYYTLWNVEAQGDYVLYQYMQNLSTDLNKAKAKQPTAMVDLTLKGKHSYKVYCPLPPNTFRFGKHKGELFEDCTDFDYLAWYYNRTDDAEAKDYIYTILSQNGYRIWEDDGIIVSNEEYQCKVWLKGKFPTFAEKIRNNQPFRFKAEKNLHIGYLDGGEFAKIVIPFCNIYFADYEERKFQDILYYIPTINGIGYHIKNHIVCIDEYNYTQHDSLTFDFVVIKWHIEYQHS